MVSITKRPAKGTINIRSKKNKVVAVSFATLIIIVLIGMHSLSWFASFVVSTRERVGQPSLEFRNNNNDPPRLLRITQQNQEERGQRQKQQQQYLQRAKSILVQLDLLSKTIPLSSSSSNEQQSVGKAQKENQQQLTNKNKNNMELQFLSTVRKECIPGRDDSNGEMNPTTHRQRECLRHVPTRIDRNKKSNNNHKSKEEEEEDRKLHLPKPRIGVMFPPGYIGQSFANWITDALKHSPSRSSSSTMDVDILSTSHVPVYGYGKSHGYTKLIRFVPLPLPLAVYDAYLYGVLSSSSLEESSSSSSSSSSSASPSLTVVDSSSLRDALERIMKTGTNNIASGPLTTETMGGILRLILRWHCRLSHVSAHTAMLTLSVENVIKDPTTTLTNVLSFVWREDLEWEGRGGNGNQHPPPPSLVSGGNSTMDWKMDAEDLLVNYGESFRELLDVTSLIVNATISLTSSSSSSSSNDKSFQQTIADAFASEMDRSSGMTDWPCPSFWEDLVEDGEHKPTTDTSNVPDDTSQMMMQVLHRIAGNMVPNCSDDDPFARCTVNKDRCEVKRTAKCN